ncbi:MAG: hypothetical protein U0Q15_09460 [Kineosporiaceae bacterium]
MGDDTRRVRVIAEEPWSWMLYEDGDALVLDVVCSVGPATFTRALRLSDDDRRRYLGQGRAVLAGLAAGVQGRAHLPDDGPLTGFDTDPLVREAALRWRARASG